MARINLLPWREAQRVERQRQFLVSMLMTAVLGVVLVFLIGMAFDQQISRQEARNRMLQQEITRLQDRIRRIEQLEETRGRLISRKEIIEELQASRSATVELMDKMARSIPAGVTLVSVRQQGANITLEGTSQSNSRVSAYLQELEESDLFLDPDLRFVRSGATPANPAEPYEFAIGLRLRPPRQREEEDVVVMDEEEATS